MRPIHTYFFVTFLCCLALDAAALFGLSYLLGPTELIHFRPDAPALWLGAVAVLAHAFLCAWTRDDDELGSYPFLRSLIIVVATVLLVCLFDAAFLGWILANKASALVITGNKVWGFATAWMAYIMYVGRALWVLGLELSVTVLSTSIPMALKLSYAAFLGAAWFWTLLILHALRVLRTRELANISKPENQLQ